jgi:hypothetical protein
LNDETMVKKLMSEVSYLTEQDMIRIEEQKKRYATEEKKKKLKTMHANLYKKINPELHNKTHFKAALSMLHGHRKLHEKAELINGNAQETIKSLLVMHN